MDKLLEEIKETLEIKRDFKKVVAILKTLDNDTLQEILIWLAIDTQNISYYFVVLQLIHEKETANLHLIASRMLSVSLVAYEGAETIALNHLRRAINIDENNINLKLELLSFFESPERLVSEREVKNIIENYYSYASKELKDRIDNIKKRRNWE